MRARRELEFLDNLGIGGPGSAATVFEATRQPRIIAGIGIHVTGAVPSGREYQRGGISHGELVDHARPDGVAGSGRTEFRATRAVGRYLEVGDQECTGTCRCGHGNRGCRGVVRISSPHAPRRRDRVGGLKTDDEAGRVRHGPDAGDSPPAWRRERRQDCQGLRTGRNDRRIELTRCGHADGRWIELQQCGREEQYGVAGDGRSRRNRPIECRRKDGDLGGIGDRARSGNELRHAGSDSGHDEVMMRVVSRRHGTVDCHRRQ